MQTQFKRITEMCAGGRAWREFVLKICQLCVLGGGVLIQNVQQTGRFPSAEACKIELRRLRE